MGGARAAPPAARRQTHTMAAKARMQHAPSDHAKMLLLVVLPVPCVMMMAGGSVVQRGRRARARSCDTCGKPSKAPAARAAGAAQPSARCCNTYARSHIPVRRAASARFTSLTLSPRV